MKVFNNLLEVKKDKNTILTLGTFDGIHLGHKKNYRDCCKKSL